MHVIVVGAGLAGLLASHVLATRGHRVTILESRAAPCRGASFSVIATSGEEAPQMAVSAAAFSERLKRRLSSNTGIRYTAKDALRYSGFISSLVKESDPERVEMKEKRCREMSLEAARHLNALSTQNGFNLERSMGFLMLSTEGALRTPLGSESRLTTDYARAAQPMLAESLTITDALFNPSAYVFSPSLLARELKEALQANSNVAILNNTRAIGFIKDSLKQTIVGVAAVTATGSTATGATIETTVHIQGNAVLVAAGTGALDLLPADAFKAPATDILAPISRFMLTAPLTEGSTHTPVGMRFNDDFLSATIGENIRVCGPWQLGITDEIDADTCFKTIWTAAMDFIPESAIWQKGRYLSQSILSSPDGFPMAGATNLPGLYVSIGGMHGASWATLSAAAAAEAIDFDVLGENTIDESILDALSPLRFAR